MRHHAYRLHRRRNSDQDFRASCTMTFTLYNAPQSTCSQRVRFALNAKDILFDEIKLDLLAGDQLKPDYLALNPNGVVPTLDHDGAIIIDSSVIIEYLDEIAPEPTNFTPEDPVLRARMRTLMHFIDEMAAAAVRVPTFNLAFLPRFAAMSEEAFKAFAESDERACCPSRDRPAASSASRRDRQGATCGSTIRRSHVLRLATNGR